MDAKHRASVSGAVLGNQHVVAQLARGLRFSGRQAVVLAAITSSINCNTFDAGCGLCGLRRWQFNRQQGIAHLAGC